MKSIQQICSNDIILVCHNDILIWVFVFFHETFSGVPESANRQHMCVNAYGQCFINMLGELRCTHNLWQQKHAIFGSCIYWLSSPSPSAIQRQCFVWFVSDLHTHTKHTHTQNQHNVSGKSGIGVHWGIQRFVGLLLRFMQVPLAHTTTFPSDEISSLVLCMSETRYIRTTLGWNFLYYASHWSK